MARKKPVKPRPQVTAPKSRVTAKPKARKRKAVLPAVAPSQPLQHRALLPVGDVFVIRQGEVATVHITVEPGISDVTVTLNGHLVWRGQP